MACCVLLCMQYYAIGNVMELDTQIAHVWIEMYCKIKMQMYSPSSPNMLILTPTQYLFLKIRVHFSQHIAYPQLLRFWPCNTLFDTKVHIKCRCHYGIIIITTTTTTTISSRWQCCCCCCTICKGRRYGTSWCLGIITAYVGVVGINGDAFWFTVWIGVDGGGGGLYLDEE